ncbi:hypothetical protein [Spirillospora sp. NPDC048819]|uniref:hypothetical protein n=1 Tax=Spirillospora sp. NPDC048819 TaxID=3155268 RepID=UPI0033C9FB02
MPTDHLPMQFQTLAVLSTGIYFSGLAYFKMAAANMRPLRGDRPWMLTREMLSSGTWFTGATVLAVGAAVQVAALSGLSVLKALPMFLVGVVVLLVLAIPILGERLTPREWGCVLLLAGATALFVQTGAAAHPPAEATAPAPVLVVAVALPSLLVPCIAFLGVDLARKGTHSRPLTGVAFAIHVGLLTGTSELMLNGAADLMSTAPTALLAAPYLYIFAIAALLALGQLQIALQRSRLVVVGLVATATAKTYLLITATVLYDEPWPADRTQVALALALTILAIVAVPHHEPRTAPPRLPRESAAMH